MQERTAAASRSSLEILAVIAPTLASLLLMAVAPATGHADLLAARIDETNLAQLQLGGADAVGGIGDWGVSNGTLCAVVTDPSHEGYLLPTGGSLVDLGFCGREDDEFVVFEPLVNLSREATPRWSGIDAEVANSQARVRVRGDFEGVAMETEYGLDSADPKRLLITTRLRRQSAGERLFAFGDVTIHMDGAMRPFMLARKGFSEGFHHQATGDATITELVGSIVPVDSAILIGSNTTDSPISYAVRVLDAHLALASGERKPVPVFGLSTETVTSVAALSRPLWLGSNDSLGILELAQSLFMDIEEGETLTIRREIRVAARVDAAEFTDRLHAQAPLLRGRVSEPQARVHIRTATGSALTVVAPDAEGRFAVKVPAGALQVEVRAPGGRKLERGAELPPAGLDLGMLELPEAAWIEIPEDLAPARLAFRGDGSTPNPLFGDDLLGFQMGGDDLPAITAASDLHLGGLPSDPKRVAIAPGGYRVYATRGLEFGITQQSFTIESGQTQRLTLATPQRAIETPGWIAADLHVHAAPSDDSTVPMQRRLASFLAEGGEVLVATDHDHVTDYAPLIEALGLRSRVRSIVGLEVTSVVSTEQAPATAGHSNVFPLPYRPKQPRKGALHSEGRRLRDIIAAARAIPGERLVQLNHGRERTDAAIANEGAFLSHLSVGRSFAPRLPLSANRNRSLLEADPETGLRDVDFDAMELLNGPSAANYEALREDWLSLLRQGQPKTATANSDTHSLHRIAAVPRTYVRLEDDAPSAFDEGSFVRSLRRGSAIGTTGPFVDMKLGDAGPGDRFAGRSGTLHVSVRAAPWIPVSQLRVLVDGELAHAQTIAAPADVEIPIEVEADAFVSVEVEGRPDALYRAVLPGFTPLAFTNPIFVDADSDEAWTPPGLP